MRASAVPADTMTIDCLSTGKRIIFVLHDHAPDIVHYQYSYKDKDPSTQFEQLSLGSINSETLFTLVENYFLEMGH